MRRLENYVTMTASSDTLYVLAIDLGSGGPKVALVSDRGELVDHTFEPTATQFLPGGGVEQDPHAWWQAIDTAARRILEKQPVPTDRIIAVSCASQWSVTVPVDAQGEPLMNAVHWMDTRGAPYTRAVTDGRIKLSGYGVRRLYRWLKMTGGVPPHSGADALAHLLFIQNERPDVYAATHKFLEPMDFINVKLTGRFAASHATVFPYLLTDNRDNTRIDYDEVLLGWSGLDREKLPDLLPVDAVLGPILPEIAEAWGLDEQTHVVVGSCDSHAATLGSGAVGDYEGHVCIGTSSWLSCHVPFKKTDLFRFISTMPSALRGKNMVVAEQGMAGKCLELFVRNWLFPDDSLSLGPPPADVYHRVEQLAESVPAGSEGLIFMPWLNGAGPPRSDSTARGGFLNQTPRTGRAHAVRAIMEGIAYNLRWLHGSVERFTRRRFDTLNFIGGGAQSELWCQILADVLNRPIRQVAGPSQAIVRGAALSALITLGHLKTEDVSALVKIANTYQPDPDHRRTYDQVYGEFVNSYKSNRRIFSRLSTGPVTATAPAATASNAATGSAAESSPSETNEALHHVHS